MFKFKAITWIKSEFLYFCIQFFHINTFQYRHLTANEIAMARTVFADHLNYSSIFIFNVPYLPWQPNDLFMAPTGHIFVNPKNYKLDYSLENLGYQCTFIHELAHVLQYQKKVNVLFKGAFLQSAYYLSFKKYNPYYYSFNPNKLFWDYNIEQQADIAKDIFLKRIPNILQQPE